MILRKPYAFIIKHFRLIHLILMGIIIFLFISIQDIYRLYVSLQKTSTYTYAGAFNYVNNIVFWFILAGLFLSGVVFWLLKEKKKPTVLYLCSIVYFIALVPGFIYEFNVLKGLSEKLIETDSLLLARDISLLMTLPAYVLIAVCAIRGIGFNIKQFNFSKDIAELQIVDKDSAEFELLVGQNNYKYFRTIRRTLRECKYYILENKFTLSCIAVVLAVGFIGLGIYYYNEYSKKYAESELISVNGVSYVVNKSYITAYDFNGKRIKKGFKYVVVDMTFYNSRLEDTKLNLDTITLNNGELSYYPTLNRNGKFYDLGVPYNDGDKIRSQQYLDATLTFEIPEGVKSKNFVLKVQSDINSVLGDVVIQYKNFDVNAVNIDAKPLLREYNFNETINSDIVGKNKFSITFKNYDLMDNYDDKYIVCTTLSNCRPKSELITSTTNSNSKLTMLVVDYKSELADSANFAKTFNNDNKIFANYGTVVYTVFGKEYREKVSVAKNSDVDGKVFILVNREIVRAQEIKLILNFRNDVYTVNLKTLPKTEK